MCIERAWSPRKQPSPLLPSPYNHTASLFGRVLVYSPYWATREQIFDLDPSAFIMAPWWRTEKESDTIIPTLTLLSQHTWWASGGKIRNFNQRFLTSCSRLCCIWAAVLSQVCVLCPWKSSSANVALLDWVKLQQVSSIGRSVMNALPKERHFFFYFSPFTRQIGQR